MLDQVQLKKDIRLALDNLKLSKAPITEFNVSAVLTTKSGKKYSGVNIESSTLTPSICAERTAFFKAISEGDVEFESIVVLGGKKRTVTEYTPPCGVCRPVSYTHLRAHETRGNLVCRLLLEKKKKR